MYQNKGIYYVCLFLHSACLYFSLVIKIQLNLLLICPTDKAKYIGTMYLYIIGQTSTKENAYIKAMVYWKCTQVIKFYEAYEINCIIFLSAAIYTNNYQFLFQAYHNINLSLRLHDQQTDFCNMAARMIVIKFQNLREKRAWTFSE